VTRLRLLNVSAAALSLAVSVAFALPVGSFERTRDRDAARRAEAAGGLRDASGHFVPFKPYRRIVAASTVADTLLRELAEPERVAAYTHYGASRSLYGYQLSGKPAPQRVEEMIALQPDLVLINAHGRPDLIARLRDAGIEVFDLGQMAGLSTLLPNIVTVAQLLGRPEHGALLARRFERRMHDIARHIPVQDRPAGMYLSCPGGVLLGGTLGSSYHDVLEAAGVRDVAAERYVGWPKYGSEQLLALDPEVIVTQQGMTGPLCRHPGLDRLRACGPDGRIVEIDGALLGDPSLHMLEAAETLFEAVHGASASHTSSSRTRAREPVQVGTAPRASPPD
jgi:iron complex transport system substrate-binding protein